MASQSSPKRILIVDDHAIVRKGIAQLVNDEPDLEVCAESESSHEATNAIVAFKPALAIIDLSLRNESGLDLIKEIKARHPDVAVLVLSMHDESFYAERAIRAGASGYIMKEEAADAIIEAIRQVLAGEIYLSRRVAGSILGRVAGRKDGLERSPIDRLTDRQLHVLRLIGRGMRTRDVAGELHLSVKTIENHREHIKAKLGLKSASELMRFAVQWSMKES